MKKKRICVVTGSRAEYGLLHKLISLIRDEKNMLLQIVVTGSHLSHNFGNTQKEIINDGFKISKKINIFNNKFTRWGHHHLEQ